MLCPCPHPFSLGHPVSLLQKPKPEAASWAPTGLPGALGALQSLPCATGEARSWVPGGFGPQIGECLGTHWNSGNIRAEWVVRPRG